jgi:hypothetical protein
MLESQLAETERDISTIRQHRDEHAANLHEARTRIDALEDENTNARLEAQVASARLEEELQRRRAIEKQLEASRQELLLARAEADARRLEAQVAAERIRTLENTDTVHVHALDLLSRLKSGIDALSRVSREQLLTVLVEQLRREFHAVGLFAVGQNGFRLWNTQPAEPTLFPSNVVAPKGDSLLSRAATERVAVRAETSPSVEIRGLSEQVIAHAIAIPIIAQQRVLAIVYAENPPDRMSRGPQILIAAEMLVDCLHRRLNQSQSSSIPEEGLRAVQAATDESLSANEDIPAENHRDGVMEPAAETMTQTYPISRQAARLRLAGSVQLLVDGVASTLVDVSTLGAQVVSPGTLRPNRTVRLLLPNGEGGLICTGRIMWAQLEAPKGDRPAQYRSGIQFLDVQLAAMESFMARHRSPKAPIEDAATLPS